MPDRIYAVGGGGIELITNLFAQEWVLEEILQPREGGAESVRVYLFDTALDEQGQMQEQVRELRERRDELKARFREDEEYYGEVGHIEFVTHVLTDELNLTTRLDLTEQRVVDQMAADQQFDSADWWLEQADIEENLDFSTGVYRRRALARATYFRADADSRDLSNMIDMPSSGRAAIVVGLGGGTGSGLCIDIGQRLLDRSPTSDVTLFGVLPSPKEDDRVRANAYAALSELEHVQLGGDHGARTGAGPLFKDVVLLPIDPTDYEGKKGDTLGTTADLEEFDAAFPYPFLSYYNTNDNEELFDTAPAFAPFTIAVPQVLRYSVAAIRQARASLDDAITHLDEMYEAGIALHRDVDEFLHGEFPAPDDPDLTDRARADLAARLETLESFVDSELFHEQEYVSAEQFEDLIATARDRGDGSVVDTIEKFEALADGLTSTSVNFVDETDKAVAELIETGATFLATRLTTLRQAAAVTDPTLRDAIQTTLDVGRKDINDVKLKRQRVEKQEEELRRDVTALEEAVDEAETALDDARAEQQSAIERKRRSWEAGTEAAREALRHADDIAVDRLFDGLEQALRQFTAGIEAADSEQAVTDVSAAPVHDALNDLEQALDRVGLDAPAEGGPTEVLRRDAIERSLDLLRDAREASLRTDADGGLLSRLWKTSAEKEAEEAENRLRNKRASLEREDVFEVRGLDAEGFTVEVSYGIDQALEAVDLHLDERRRAVTEALATELDGELAQSDRDELLRLLERGQFDDISDTVRTIIEADLSVPDELTTERDRLTERLSKKRTQLSAYEATLSVLEEVVDNGPRQAYATAEAAFQDAQERYDAVGGDLTTDEDHLYIKQVQPHGSIHDDGASDIAMADLLGRQAERRRAKRVIDDLAEQTLGHEYLSLHARRIDDGTERYRGHKVSVGVLSRETQHIDDIVDVNTTFEQAFGLQGGHTDYGSWHEPLGARWDVGMSVFVSGVFLDNLRNISAYRDGYRQRREKARSVHLHHALGLEAGTFCRRGRVLTVADDADVEFLTGRPDEQAVSERIRGEFTEHVAVEAARNGAARDAPSHAADSSAVTDDLSGGDVGATTGDAGRDGDTARDTTVETDGGDH